MSIDNCCLKLFEKLVHALISTRLLWLSLLSYSNNGKAQLMCMWTVHGLLPNPVTGRFHLKVGEQEMVWLNSTFLTCLQTSQTFQTIRWWLVRGQQLSCRYSYLMTMGSMGSMGTCETREHREYWTRPSCALMRHECVQIQRKREDLSASWEIPPQS